MKNKIDGKGKNRYASIPDTDKKIALDALSTHKVKQAQHLSGLFGSGSNILLINKFYINSFMLLITNCLTLKRASYNIRLYNLSKLQYFTVEVY